MKMCLEISSLWVWRCIVDLRNTSVINYSRVRDHLLAFFFEFSNLSHDLLQWMELAKVGSTLPQVENVFYMIRSGCIIPPFMTMCYHVTKVPYLGYVKKLHSLRKAVGMVKLTVLLHTLKKNHFNHLSNPQISINFLSPCEVFWDFHFTSQHLQKPHLCHYSC